MKNMLRYMSTLYLCSNLFALVGFGLNIGSDSYSIAGDSESWNVDGGTNASNGTFQIPPIHHEWNKDSLMIPSAYEPVQPRPDWYQALEGGVPGVHYPLPEE